MKIMAFSLITSWELDGDTVETVSDFIFGGSKITADGDCTNLKMLTVWKKSYDQTRQHIKKHRHYFAYRGPSSQGYGFSSNHVWMWELDYKQSWVPKNWCFWTVVLEKTLESPLDCKKIQPMHSEGGQPWDFFGRNDAKAEAPVLWPPHAKSWLIGKDSDAGRDWGQEEKGMVEDEMAGWHRWLDGCELSELRELVMDRETWHAVIHEVAKTGVGHVSATELNWTVGHIVGVTNNCLLWKKIGIRNVVSVVVLWL